MLKRRSLRKQSSFVGLCLLTGVFSGVLNAAELKSVSLNDGWKVRSVEAPEHPEAAKWIPAVVPGSVQQDLMRAGLLPDLFVSDNEKKAQWVAHSDWEYQTTLNVSAATLAHEHVQLVFDGLNTYADVFVNGKQALHADNMFRRWDIDAKPLLKTGANELRVVVRSPYKVMTPIVEKLPYILPGTGYEPLDKEKHIVPISHYIRTAPYQYGWDWGPALVTEGIWRDVRMETWDEARLDNFYIDQQSVRKSAATLLAQAEVKASSSMTASAVLRYSGPDGVEKTTRVDNLHFDSGVNKVQIPLQILNPRLWYPSGYGAQDRYRFSLTVYQGAKIIAQKEVKTGLRSVELRREKDQWGKSFEFVINGIPVFIKGANVVPFDSFPASLTEARHRLFLQSAKDANMNMVRTWGGAYYESDDFYDLCDELGIMVWQEFMFGGALVPGDVDFQQNVKQEAVEQVTRLRTHPSVVFWCGNNEVETSWDSWGDRLTFRKSLTPEQREKVWQDYVVLFRDVLKGVVAEHGNHAPYWPSSPGADFEEKAGNNENGDVHYWTVWSGGAPITEYLKQDPRFMSEYGFQAMPDWNTIRYFAGADTGNFDSPAMKDHQRFINGNDRIKKYLAEEYREPKDFESFVYLSQSMQAEAIKLAAEHLRTLRPRAMGSLYWQLNDCWPAISWASIDYFGRWKALNYYARRFYAPVLAVPVLKEDRVQLYAVSDQQTAVPAKATLTAMDFQGKVLGSISEARQVAPLNSAVVLEVPLSDLLKGADREKTVIVAEISDPKGVISRNLLFFDKMKGIALPKPTLQQTWKKTPSGYDVRLTTDVLAKGVALFAEQPDLKLSDNYFDLLPGESRTIHIETAVDEASLRKTLHLLTVADSAK